MSNSPTQDELLLLAHNALRDSMQSLGIKTTAQGRAIQCVDAPVKILCFEVEVSGQGRIVSLAIHVKLGDEPDAPVISECIAGFDSDLKSAMNKAVMNWMFSVLLAALAWHNVEGCPAHMSSVETRQFSDSNGHLQTWRIVSSPAVAMGEFEGKPEELDTKATLAPLFDELTQMPGTHWVKVLLMNYPDEESNSDCTVDNVTSEPGKHLLVTSQTLPKAPVLRQFHILSPLVSETPTANPVELPIPSRKSFWSRFKK